MSDATQPDGKQENGRLERIRSWSFENYGLATTYPRPFLNVSNLSTAVRRLRIVSVSKFLSLILGLILVWVSPRLFGWVLEQESLLNLTYRIAEKVQASPRNKRPPPGKTIAVILADEHECYPSLNDHLSPTGVEYSLCYPLDRSYLASLTKAILSIGVGIKVFALDVYGWETPRREDALLAKVIENLSAKKIVLPLNQGNTPSLKTFDVVRAKPIIVVGDDKRQDVRASLKSSPIQKSFINSGIVKFGFVDVNRDYYNVPTRYPYDNRDELCGEKCALSFPAQIYKSSLVMEEEKKQFERDLWRDLTDFTISIRRTTIVSAGSVRRVNEAMIRRMSELPDSTSPSEYKAKWRELNPCAPESSEQDQFGLKPIADSATGKTVNDLEEVRKLCDAEIAVFGVYSRDSPPGTTEDFSIDEHQVGGLKMSGAELQASYVASFFSIARFTAIDPDILHRLELTVAIFLVIVLIGFKYTVTRLFLLTILLGFLWLISLSALMLGYVFHSLPYLVAISLHSLLHEGIEAILHRAQADVELIFRHKGGI